MRVITGQGAGERESTVGLRAHSGHSFRGTRIPEWGVAVLEALRISRPNFELLESLDEREWTRALHLCDASQLTLTLGHVCRPALPAWVRGRIEGNHASYEKRFARLQCALFDIASRLGAKKIDFVLLKGFAQPDGFTPDPVLRAQGDIDLWCLPESVFDAQAVLLELGYHPIGPTKGRHLPPMARERTWEWRGDYFDPALPIPVDLHYKLWDEELEQLEGPCEPELWERRGARAARGQHLPVLCDADAIGFAALHLLMHTLHGDVRLQRAWEIAHFLQSRLEDGEFWREWAALHSPQFRQLEMLVFRLACEWFGAQLPQALEEEAERLNEDVKFWIDQYALSPVEALFVPKKTELWLHLALLSSYQAKVRVFLRRMFPVNFSRVLGTPNSDAGARTGMRGRSGLQFLRGRIFHHTSTLLPTLVEGVRWWWLRQGLGRQFLVFQLASALFDVGEFVFFLLYNLYLLDLGYSEAFIGKLSSATTAGTFAAALPGVWLTRRLGLRSAVLIAIGGAALASAARALAESQAHLLAAAFLQGAFLSLWAVSLPPAVASLTREGNRVFGFSVISSVGVGMGVLGGFAGGQLPGMFAYWMPYMTTVATKRASLLAGSAIVILGVIPAFTLDFPRASGGAERKIYPRGRFIVSFLAALFVWSVATGAFNPFFNTYFSRVLHMSIARIGTIFSITQLVQVVALLGAPAILRRTGEIKGIAALQVATAAALVWLMLAANATEAAFVYGTYMCCQYMSEPCVFSMLMSRVGESERSGASALNFLVSSFAGAISALVAGHVISKNGYSILLGGAAILAVMAALLFYKLVGRSAESHRN